MNICIGGCWHGSKLLKDQKSNHFLAKDKISGEFTTYERFTVQYAEKPQVFWIANSLSRLEVNEKVMPYLEKIKQNLNYQI